jgi:hypothetical protein
MTEHLGERTPYNDSKWEKALEIGSLFFSKISDRAVDFTEKNWVSELHKVHEEVWNSSYDKSMNPSELFNILETTTNLMNEPQIRKELGIDSKKSLKINRDWFTKHKIRPVLDADKSLEKEPGWRRRSM